MTPWAGSDVHCFTTSIKSCRITFWSVAATFGRSIPPAVDSSLYRAWCHVVFSFPCDLSIWFSFISDVLLKIEVWFILLLYYIIHIISFRRSCQKEWWWWKVSSDPQHSSILYNTLLESTCLCGRALSSSWGNVRIFWSSECVTVLMPWPVTQKTANTPRSIQSSIYRNKKSTVTTRYISSDSF